MKFTKMHGIGNDYVYINAIENVIENPSALSEKLSDRHFGIGSDGLILIAPSDKAHRHEIHHHHSHAVATPEHGLTRILRSGNQRQSQHALSHDLLRH